MFQQNVETAHIASDCLDTQLVSAESWAKKVSSGGAWQEVAIF